MTQRTTLSHPDASPQGGSPVAARLVWTGMTAIGLIFVAAAGMWLHYGTAVFFETIAAGIAACF